MEQTLLSRMTVDKMAAVWEKFGNIFLASSRQRRLRRTDFTILSNNCWGGHVYRHFGLPYLSPTVGLYFYAEEFIHFLKDWKRYIFAPLQVIHARDSRYAADLIRKRQDKVPIGVLGGEIEIVFLHYKTPTEVYEKWKRRVERVNASNVFVKFSEQNLCEKRHIDSFCALPFEHKLLLLAKPYAKASEGIVVKRYTKNGQVSNDTSRYADYVVLEDWLNGVQTFATPK